MIISTGAEKTTTFNTVQHSLMIKILKKQHVQKAKQTHTTNNT